MARPRKLNSKPASVRQAEYQARLRLGAARLREIEQHALGLRGEYESILACLDGDASHVALARKKLAALAQDLTLFKLCDLTSIDGNGGLSSADENQKPAPRDKEIR